MNNIAFTVYRAALLAKFRRLFFGIKDPYLPLPEGTLLSPSTGIAAAFADIPRRLSFDPAGMKNPEDWQNRARAKLADLAGYPLSRPEPILTLSRSEEPLGEDIVKRSVYLRIRPKTDLPIHLIYRRSITKPAPGFLYLAGSTSGVHLAWGGTRVPIDHQRVTIGADMALQAARRGYLAVAVEQAGYGERGERHLPKRSSDRTIDTANHLLLLGRTLMGDGATDVSSAIDWLLGKESPVQVDAERLFLFGHSAGGTLAQFASALDPRIKGVLASGSVGPVRDTIGSRGAGSGHGIIPGFLTWFDTADMIALIAPRPFIGLSGTRDHIFPAAGVQKVIDGARPFYERLGAGAAIQAVAVDGSHQYHAEASWAAWNKWIDCFSP